jgi:hypothetical protein
MIELPLKSLSTEEKIQVMETLWDDLCRQAEGLESPAWHEDILAPRESANARGTEQFTGWEDAKRAIRNQVS